MNESIKETLVVLRGEKVLNNSTVEILNSATLQTCYKHAPGSKYVYFEIYFFKFSENLEN